MAEKRGLQLDRVVLLGRTMDEYRRAFGFGLEELRGLKILDVASGVSSFRAEANNANIDVTAFDPIYALGPDVIAGRCQPDLDSIYKAIGDLPTYRWGSAYQSPEQMKDFRERAYKLFLLDYGFHKSRYVAGYLPNLPFPDDSFDWTFASYFLFVYQDQFSYEFHRDSIREIMRVTRGEARIYPLVTFEAHRSEYIDRIKSDDALSGFRFEEVSTEFEFLVGSNAYLRITHS